jgi:hypothetical protein
VVGDEVNPPADVTVGMKDVVLVDVESLDVAEVVVVVVVVGSEGVSASLTFQTS